MEPEPENDSRKEEITKFVSTESSKEEVKRKGQEKSDHDGSEADTGEVDGPVGSGKHEGREQASASPVKELPAEEVDAQDGEGTEKNGGKLKTSEGIAENVDEKGLDIDEESFPSEVGRVENFVRTCFQGMDGIDTVGGFIRVETNRNILYMIEADDKGQNQNSRQYQGDRTRRAFSMMHSEEQCTIVLCSACCIFCFYVRIIAKLEAKEKYFGMGIFSQLGASFDSNKRNQKEVAFDVPPINPEDISKRGRWENAQGETLRIDFDTNTMSEFPSGESALVDLTDTAALQKKLKEGQYVFVPAVVDETKQDVTPVVVDLGAARLAKGLEATPAELADQNKWQEADGELDTKMIEAQERITAALTKSAESVNGADAGTEDEREQVQTKINNILEWLETITSSDKAAKKAAGLRGLSEEYIRGRQERLQKMEEYAQEAKDLVQEINDALADGEDTRMSTESADTTPEPGAGSGEAPSQREKGKGSGPGGPEGPKEFEAILEGLRVKVMGLIDGIKTLEEYKAFREGMVVVPSKEADRRPHRHFFDLEDIKDRVKRRLEDEELSKLNALERELERAVRKKFSDLKSADNESALETFLEHPGSKEKIEFLQGTIQKAYQVYRKHIDQEVGGKISNREREELWRQKDGEQILKKAIVEHLRVFNNVEPEVGEKIFYAMIKKLEESH